MIFNKLKITASLIGLIALSGCKVTQVTQDVNHDIPLAYNTEPIDTTNNRAKMNWRTYYRDSNLIALIDTALLHNQELNIMLQEIDIAQNEVRVRKGEYLPFVGVGAGLGMDKSAQYTRNGAVEEGLEIAPDKPFPKPLADMGIGLNASWELDVWKKLRNAKQAAYLRYLGTIEGRNFMVTQLISEIAENYYELMGLDNMLNIVNQNAVIQANAFNIAKQQKNAARVTQLAVNRFQAQMLNTQNLAFDIKQEIVERENKINYLVGRYYKKIPRDSIAFEDYTVDTAMAGVPSQLLLYRPDIRQRELELEASKLDVKSAKANFYPNFRITAGVGLQAFSPAYFFHPESILYNLAGDMIAPLINRNAIQANYKTATDKQIQAIYDYDQTVLNAYFEAYNQIYKLSNYNQSFQVKSEQVKILRQSVDIAASLYKYARADYSEVLLTQREALEAKLDLIEVKLKQLRAKVNLYKALGGGWTQ